MQAHPLSLKFIAACGAALISAPLHAQTPAYPSKPLRIIVPFPAGGSSGLLAHTVGQKLTEAWGQQTITDYRPGAGSNLGIGIASRAAPDGYNILVTTITTSAIAMATYAKPGYDLVKDFEPVSLLGNLPHVLVVHPSLPVRNVSELIALAKSRPGQLNFASQGNGTLSHLEFEMLKQLGKFNAVHVPYKGSVTGLTDLVAGNVQGFFDSIQTSLPYVRSGRLRALGIASSKRSPALPDLPALNESFKGFDADSWFGMLVPVGTPREVVVKLNEAVQKILVMKELQDLMLPQGVQLIGSTPEQLRARINEEIIKWGTVVRTANVKVE